MGSIFDIEEKSNKKIDRDYLISNGWSKRLIGQFGVVYKKPFVMKKDSHSLLVFITIIKMDFSITVIPGKKL